MCPFHPRAHPWSLRQLTGNITRNIKVKFWTPREGRVEFSLLGFGGSPHTERTLGRKEANIEPKEKDPSLHEELACCALLRGGVTTAEGMGKTPFFSTDKHTWLLENCKYLNVE